MSTFPGVAGQIEEAIGTELTARLLQRWGGCQIEIPVRAKGSKLSELIGLDAAELLIRELGHGRLTLPCGSMRGVGGRRRQARKMLQNGASLQDVALACDLHTRTVSRYRSEMEAQTAERQMRLPFDTD